MTSRYSATSVGNILAPHCWHSWVLPSTMNSLAPHSGWQTAKATGRRSGKDTTPGSVVGCVRLPSPERAQVCDERLTPVGLRPQFLEPGTDGSEQGLKVISHSLSPVSRYGRLNDPAVQRRLGAPSAASASRRTVSKPPQRNLQSQDHRRPDAGGLWRSSATTSACLATSEFSISRTASTTR